MPRKVKATPHGKKVRITVTVEPDLVAWVMAQKEAGVYRSLSHAVDRGLALLRDRDNRR